MVRTDKISNDKLDSYADGRTRCTRLVAHHVGPDSGAQFQEEYEGEQHGEGDGHAVVLLDRAAAAKEGDEEDDAANNNEEDGSVEELVAEKVKILGVRPLDHSAGHYQEKSRKLNI